MPIRRPLRVVVETWLPPIVGMAVILAVWSALIRWKDLSPLLAPSHGDSINGVRDHYPDLLTAMAAMADNVLLNPELIIQELIRLRLPSAVPLILTGIRVSSGPAIIGTILDRFIVGTGDPSGGRLGFEIAVAASNGAGAR